MGVVVELETKKGKKYNFPRIIYNHLKEFKNRVEQELDAPIIITGEVGSGKSNLGIGLCGTWEEVLFNREFSLDKVHFSSDSLRKETNRHDNITSAQDFDESIEGGSSGDSTSKVGKRLRKVLVTKRFKRHLLIFCVDNLKELNDKIIERCVIWYHINLYRTKSGKFRKGIIKIFNTEQALRVYTDLKEKKYFLLKNHPIVRHNRFFITCNDYMNLWFNKEDYEKKKSVETGKDEEEEDKKLPKLTPKRMEYLAKIPLSSVFGNDSKERHTLGAFIKEIREYLSGVNIEDDVTSEG